MNTYEMTVILTDADKNHISKIKKIIEDQKGILVEEKKWGDRTLKYRIKKKTTGYYHQFIFKSEPKTLATIKKQFNFEASILRFLIIKL